MISRVVTCYTYTHMGKNALIVVASCRNSKPMKIILFLFFGLASSTENPGTQTFYLFLKLPVSCLFHQTQVWKTRVGPNLCEPKVGGGCDFQPKLQSTFRMCQTNPCEPSPAVGFETNMMKTCTGARVLHEPKHGSPGEVAPLLETPLKP